MSKNRNLLPRILAVAGTILVWLPVLSPLFFSFSLWIRAGIFRLDYLMPAELFPMVLTGSLLLLWAAICVNYHPMWIVIPLAFGGFLLVGAQVLAVVTGIASGRIPAQGWRYILVLSMLAIYNLTVILIGVVAVFLLKKIFSRKTQISNA